MGEYLVSRLATKTVLRACHTNSSARRTYVPVSTSKARPNGQTDWWSNFTGALKSHMPPNTFTSSYPPAEMDTTNERRALKSQQKALDIMPAVVPLFTTCFGVH